MGEGLCGPREPFEVMPFRPGMGEGAFETMPLVPGMMGGFRTLPRRPGPDEGPCFRGPETGFGEGPEDRRCGGDRHHCHRDPRGEFDEEPDFRGPERDFEDRKSVV